jgi:hypothetical protein
MLLDSLDIVDIVLTASSLLAGVVKGKQETQLSAGKEKRGGALDYIHYIQKSRNANKLSRLRHKSSIST